MVTGRLVVVTPDRQDTFIIRGRQPAYVPPQPSQLPSGTYLKATTAASRAKGSSGSNAATTQQQQQPANKAGSGARGTSRSGTRNTAQQPDATQVVDTTVAGRGTAEVSGEEQRLPRKNYLQQNIKAAAGQSNSRGTGQGSAASPRRWS